VEATRLTARGEGATVNVIENGTLANYLIGRVPIRDFLPERHGRGAPGSPPGPNLGVLLVKARRRSRPRVEEKVVQMVTDQGKPTVIEWKRSGGHSPRLLYRVYAKDGHEELCERGVQRARYSRAAERFDRRGQRPAGEQSSGRRGNDDYQPVAAVR